MPCASHIDLILKTMKRLQRYYLYIGIPIVLIALGSVYFQKEIMGTIEGNPHPQINYLILLLIVGGWQLPN